MRQCGACHETFQVDDRLVALFWLGDNLTALDASTDTLYDWNQRWELKVGFYTLSFCRECVTQPETATIHADCFNLYSQRCNASDKYHRLWQASISMRPWKDSDPLLLPYRGQVVDLLAFSDQLGLPMMKRLAPELRDMIRSLIGPGLLWRYSTVIQRAASLQLVPTRTARSLRLCDVQSWHRHGDATIRDALSPESSHVRVTIDSSGIKDISQLALTECTEISTSKATPSSQLFIVEKPAALSHVVVHLQDGYCRFEFLQPPSFTLLNWPLAPEAYREIIQASTKYRASTWSRKSKTIQPFNRLSFINTATCFGLTFFLHHNCIRAVHVHTSAAPTATALETFLRIPPENRRKTIWFYLPLPVGEELTALGAIVAEGADGMEARGLSVETKHQGLVQLHGQYGEPEPTSTHLVQSIGRPVLVYDATSGQVSVFARQAATTQLPWVKKKVRIPAVYAKQSRMASACTTQAPLEGVTTAHVYMSGEYHCRGILFEYEDGRAISVGQCRLGIDKVHSVQHPVRVCYATVENGGPVDNWITERTITVEFTARQTHSHALKGRDANWECHEMTGTLVFWFNYICTVAVMAK